MGRNYIRKVRHSTIIFKKAAIAGTRAKARDYELA